MCIFSCLDIMRISLTAKQKGDGTEEESESQTIWTEVKFFDKASFRIDVEPEKLKAALQGIPKKYKLSSSFLDQITWEIVFENVRKSYFSPQKMLYWLERENK